MAKQTRKRLFLKKDRSKLEMKKIDEINGRVLEEGEGEHA